jgi:hypothetical protein
MQRILVPKGKRDREKSRTTLKTSRKYFCDTYNVVFKDSTELNIHKNTKGTPTGLLASTESPKNVTLLNFLCKIVIVSFAI